MDALDSVSCCCARSHTLEMLAMHQRRLSLNVAVTCRCGARRSLCWIPRSLASWGCWQRCPFSKSMASSSECLAFSGLICLTSCTGPRDVSFKRAAAHTNGLCGARAYRQPVHALLQSCVLMAGLAGASLLYGTLPGARSMAQAC